MFHYVQCLDLLGAYIHLSVIGTRDCINYLHHHLFKGKGTQEEGVKQWPGEGQHMQKEGK